MKTICISPRKLLFVLLVALSLIATGCGPGGNPVDCSTPFAGVPGYFYFYPHSNSMATSDGQMAIHYMTIDPSADSSSDHISWARIWDGKQWNSQKLAVGDTVYWGVYFAHQGNHWHVAQTLHTGGVIGGNSRTIYQYQKADGSFTPPEFVNSITPDAIIANGGFAVSTEGKVAVTETPGGGTDRTILFSEKPATAGSAFVTETVTVGGTAIEGRPYFTGYDQAQNPLIVYTNPIILAGLYHPQQIRVLRKANGAWTDHLALDMLGFVTPNSLSAAITNANMLVLNFSSSPVQLGPIALEAITYDLTGDLPGNEQVLGNVAAALDIDIFDVYSRTVVQPNGTDTLTLSSFVHTPDSIYYSSNYTPINGFDTAKPWSVPGMYGWTAAPLINSCAGAGALVMVPRYGTNDEPWPLRVEPF